MGPSGNSVETWHRSKPRSLRVYKHRSTISTIWSIEYAPNYCHWMNQYLSCHSILASKYKYYWTFPMYQAFFSAPYTHQLIELQQQPHQMNAIVVLVFQVRKLKCLRWCISPKASQLTSDGTEIHTWFCLVPESLFLDIKLTASGERQSINTASQDSANKNTKQLNLNSDKPNYSACTMQYLEYTYTKRVIVNLNFEWK